MSSAVHHDRQQAPAAPDDQPEETSRTKAVVAGFRLGYDAGKRDGWAEGHEAGAQAAPETVELYDHCPQWCGSRDEDREDHPDHHGSVSVGGFRAIGTTEQGWPLTLHASLAQRFLHGVWDREEYLRERDPFIEIALGDEVIARLEPPAARALAAGLVRLADVEEGLTRLAAASRAV